MNKVISMSPQESYQLLQSTPNSTLIDIRSSMEYLFVGHPANAIHIAWIDEPDWEINPVFIAEITKTVSKKNKAAPLDSPIILICRSGQRTLEASKVLIDAGFTHIIHVNEGFEGERDESFHRSTIGGWRYRGLPWEQC